MTVINLGLYSTIFLLCSFASRSSRFAFLRIRMVLQTSQSLLSSGVLWVHRKVVERDSSRWLMCNRRFQMMRRRSKYGVRYTKLWKTRTSNVRHPFVMFFKIIWRKWLVFRYCIHKENWQERRLPEILREWRKGLHLSLLMCTGSVLLENCVSASETTETSINSEVFGWCLHCGRRVVGYRTCWGS